MKGLECLAQVTRCLEDWCRPLTEELHNEHREEAPNSSMLSNGGDVTDEATPPTPALDELTEFEARKQKKEMLERGIEVFNKKPKRGLKYLQDQGFVGTDANAVARFLHEEERLDRAAVGELLGEPDDMAIAIMHAYVDQTDFSKCDDFLPALRHFLVSRCVWLGRDWGEKLCMLSTLGGGV